jgi:NAD(P)-dependent dehydrogenase (short-subunit alcohol dehydrogenase family)
MGRLDGKVAFITGAASGIGRAGALLFAKEGARVAVADIAVAGGDETVAMIRKEKGEAIFIETDVTQPTAVQHAIETTIKTYGRMNVLYNDAGGTSLNDGPVTTVSLEEWWRVININLFGTFLCCKYGIPELIKAGGGSVINTASYVAIRGVTRTHAYSASKGGVLSLTLALAAEYAKDKVRANALAPGFIQTERVSRIIFSMHNVETGAGMLSKQRELLGYGMPEDVAKMALFLASDDSRLITGTVMPVDGGAASY